MASAKSGKKSKGGEPGEERNYRKGEHMEGRAPERRTKKLKEKGTARKEPSKQGGEKGEGISKRDRSKRGLFSKASPMTRRKKGYTLKEKVCSRSN